MRIVMDTTFVIDFLRDDASAVQRLAQAYESGDELMVNEIVVCEAATGAEEHPDLALLRLLEPIDFIQPGPDAAYLAGQWRAEARARGLHLSLPDALIAAAAEIAGAAVLTRNVKDFSLTSVAVETY